MPVLPPEGTLYVRGGREKRIEPLVSLLLAAPFGLRKGKWFSLSDLQVSVSVCPFRSTILLFEKPLKTTKVRNALGSRHLYPNSTLHKTFRKTG